MNTSLSSRLVEVTVLVLLLLSVNLLAPLFPNQLHLTPSALSLDQPWRWFTFPWLHVSLYHLILDASAFLFLYTTLKCRLVHRLQHLFLCIFLSGLTPILLDPRLESIGLCGLSGVAHGLMLICGLEAAAHKPTRQFGIIMAAAVLAKTLFEQLSGTVLFSAQHLGNIGTPIPSCHLGGVIGGLVSFAFVHLYSASDTLISKFRKLPRGDLQTFASSSTN